MRFWLAIGVVAGVNALNNWLAPHAYLVTCPAAAAALCGLARWDGITWAELGLGPGWIRAGLRWGMVSAGLVVVGYILVLGVPAARIALVDERAIDLSGGRLAWQALVRVPLGTVLLEEVAFRGVLWAMIRRRHGARWATCVSSALFGLWHIAPSTKLPGANAAVDAVLGTGAAARTLVVVAAVAGTAAAGVAFCELRRRSASLLTPGALHWAFNGCGYFFAWASRQPA